MSMLTRKDVTALFGELDDVVIAKIIATGATPDELAEAHAWLTNDEPLMNAGRPLPSGRVARLVDIFAAPGPSTTLVRGDRALDAVLAAAAEAGASPCVGGTPERSLAAAIRDACLTDRMPVLVCERADLVDRGLLARVAGPRCLVLAGTGPLEMVTQPG